MARRPPSPSIHSKLDTIIGLLNQIITQEKAMAVDLTGLQAELTNNTNQTSSIIALVNGLAAQIAALIAGGTDATTQAAINAVITSWQANDAALAAAVLANTPSAPPPAGTSAPAKS